MSQVGKKRKGKSKISKGQSKGKGSSQNQNQKGKEKSKGRSKGKAKGRGKGQWTTWSGSESKVKVEKQKVNEYVLTMVVKVIQQVNAGGLRKLVLQDLVQIRDKCTFSQLNLGSFRLNHAHRSAQRIPRPQTSSSAKTSQLTLLLTDIIFISGVLGLCLWPMGRQGFNAHQLRINHFMSDISEDYIMEVNFSNPIYDIGPSLPQECQEPWAVLIDTAHRYRSSDISLLLNRVFLTSPSKRSQRPSPASMVGTSRS